MRAGDVKVFIQGPGLLGSRCVFHPLRLSVLLLSWRLLFPHWICFCLPATGTKGLVSLPFVSCDHVFYSTTCQSLQSAVWSSACTRMCPGVWRWARVGQERELGRGFRMLCSETVNSYATLRQTYRQRCARACTHVLMCKHTWGWMAPNSRTLRLQNGNISTEHRSAEPNTGFCAFH